MAEVAHSLSARNLKANYLKETRAGTLVGSDVFGRLASLIAKCVCEVDGPRQIAAYTLLMFFRSAEYDFDDRAITASEAAEFYSKFHQPVLSAIEYIENIDAAPADLEKICLPVIQTHIASMPIRW